MSGEPGAVSPHEAYFFWNHRGELEAMRRGCWKLHFPHSYRSMEGREPGRDGIPGKYDYGRETGLELYDLQEDVGESRDLAGERPDVVARLTRLADLKRRELGDRLRDVEGAAVRAPGRVAAEKP